MLSTLLTFLLLIVPFIWAYAHIIILKKHDKINVFANYFIAVNAMGFMLFNAAAYTIFSEDMANFQQWAYSAALLEMGFLFLTIGIVAFIALFAGKGFKMAMCLIMAIYLLCNQIFTMITNPQETSSTTVILGFITIVLFFVFAYKLRVKSPQQLPVYDNP